MPDKILTAKEAREISGLTNEEILEDISLKIERMAKTGNRTLKYYDHGFGEYEYKTRHDEIIQELTRIGYKAKCTHDYKQFADIYLKIEW